MVCSLVMATNVLMVTIMLYLCMYTYSDGFVGCTYAEEKKTVFMPALNEYNFIYPSFSSCKHALVKSCDDNRTQYISVLSC